MNLHLPKHNRLGFWLLLWGIMALACAASGQSVNALKAKLGTAANDGEKAKIYAEMATLSLSEGMIDETIEYGNKSVELSSDQVDKRAMLALARAYKFKKQYATSLNNYLQTQKEYIRTDEKNTLAQIDTEIGELYKDWGVNEKAVEYYLTAYDLYKQLKNEEKQIDVLSDIVVAYQGLNDLNKALLYNQQLLSIYEVNNDKKRIINALSNISNLHIRLNKPEEALAEQLRILELNKELKDSLGIASALNNAGFLYKRLQQYPKSLEFFQESMTYSKERNPVTLVNIGVIHQVMGNFEPSLLSFFEAARIREKEKNGVEIARVCNYIAAVYQTLDDSETALRYTERALQFGELAKNKETLMASYRLMSDIYITLGRNKKALSYYKQYADTKDALQEEEKERLQQALEKQFEAEKKEKDLKLLLVDKEVNQLSLKRLQLETEKKERDFQLQIQQQQLDNATLKQKELEKERYLAELTLEKRRIEAEKKDQEIAMFQVSDSLQRFAIKQKELEEEERRKDIEILKQKEALSQLQIKEEQERRDQERQMLLMVLLGGSIILLLILAGYITKQRDNAKLKRHQEQIAKQNKTLSDQNMRLQEQADEISVQAEELVQQRDEIMAQRDYIEEKNFELEKQKAAIEKAYENIQILGDIGQKITSTLDLSVIVRTVYENVNQLMDAASFGVGIFNPKINALEFKDFIENGQVLPYSTDSITQKDLPSVRCFLNKEEIVIQNLKDVYSSFSISTEENRGEIPASLIYLPLMVEERSIGVITVQSFKENAYTDADVNLLRSLASYASIALDNSYAYDKLKEVNEIIKEKNQQITDSLRYARTIEESILPGNNWFEKLFDGHFIIYRPKDIVSGDFYWGHTTAHATFLAAVDCTGHGVPGAFMSMIGNALFNRIVKEARIDDPSEILVKLNAGIKEVLRREDTENSEGMDVCFCKIEQSGAQVKVTFAGAKRPLYYALAGSKELLEVKGDRISIGWPYRKQGVLQEEVKFENSELLLPKGSMLYLSTDGLSDNPGIEGKPKMGTPLIKQTLIQHMETGIAAQGNALNALLDRAQEDREQRDDITFIGVKLK